MSYNFYSALHLGAILLLGLTLGVLWGIYTHPKNNKKLKVILVSANGLSLFLIFLAGFGLIAKTSLDFPWPWWIYGKMAIWLILGSLPFFIRKSSQKQKIHRWLLPLIFFLMLTALLIVRIKPI